MPIETRIGGSPLAATGQSQPLFHERGEKIQVAAELKLFLALSLGAGVCEEIVSRGYLLAYFDSLVGSAGAVLASSLLFGLDHAYQGIAGIMKTGVWGLLYAGAYMATDSLLAPMLLHVLIDAASGMLAYLALRPAT